MKPRVKNAFAANASVLLQPGVEQEECVDAPNQRGRQRVKEQQRQVSSLNFSRSFVHDWSRGLWILERKDVGCRPPPLSSGLEPYLPAQCDDGQIEALELRIGPYPQASAS